jgi:hypothetical protein
MELLDIKICYFRTIKHSEYYYKQNNLSNFEIKNDICTLNYYPYPLMPYVSPLKLLRTYKLPVELKLDKDTLRIARQALLAEIDLSPRQSVMLGEKEMGRNDILQLFDTLQAADSWPYHEAIHLDQPLLDFLTEYKIPLKPIANNPLYNEPGFVSFLSPFYPEVFANGFIQVLKKPSFESMNALFQLPAAWNRGDNNRQSELIIKQYLRRMLTQLDQLVAPYKGKTGIIFKKKLVEPYYDHQLIDALNRLPDSYTDIRQHYGLLLIEVAYIMWNNKNKSDSNFVVRRVETLNGGYELDHHIKHYWSQCTATNSYTSDSSSGDGWGVSPWTIVVLVIFVIRMIGMCERCDRDESRAGSGSRIRFDVPPTDAYEPPSRSNSRTSSGSGSSRKAGAEKIKDVPVAPKKDQYFDPRIDRLETLLPKMDSLANVVKPRSNNAAYDALYRQLKKSNSIEQPIIEGLKK